MSVIINPGTGPVQDATELNAQACMAMLIDDTQSMDNAKPILCYTRDRTLDRGGRFGFRVWTNDKVATVEMPGLPEDRVRYRSLPGQNVFHFPRLYINGSSWLWGFAVDILYSYLYGEKT